MKIKTYKVGTYKPNRHFNRLLLVMITLNIIMMLFVGLTTDNKEVTEEIKPTCINTSKSGICIALDIDKEPTVEELIVFYSKKYNVNTDKALKIAFCESSYNPNARNNQGSTAKGVYQFINSTWQENCKGDVFNAENNIVCFMQLYPKYPNYWACNSLIN